MTRVQAPIRIRSMANTLSLMRGAGGSRPPQRMECLPHTTTRIYRAAWAEATLTRRKGGLSPAFCRGRAQPTELIAQASAGKSRTICAAYTEDAVGAARRASRNFSSLRNVLGQRCSIDIRSKRSAPPS